jgi:hypothetical protein
LHCRLQQRIPSSTTGQNVNAPFANLNLAGADGGFRDYKTRKKTPFSETAHKCLVVVNVYNRVWTIFTESMSDWECNAMANRFMTILLRMTMMIQL